MSEPEKQTKFGWLQPVVGAVLIALFAGGTAPWWLEYLRPESPGPIFNLLGKWNGSPDCIIRFFLDDGNNVKGVCDIGVVSHSVVGVYVNNKTVTLSNVRRDQNGCETKVDGSITFRDKDTVVYSQAGWDGCGVRTPPSEQILFRETKS